jgi:hypothetical protein
MVYLGHELDIIDTAREEGIAMGETKKQQKIVLSMLMNGLGDEMVIKFTGINKEDLENLKKG